MRYPLAILLTLVFTSWAQAQILERDSRFHSLAVDAQRGMVVAQEKLAAEVGAQMLEQGGNAVDAAVATGFALAVTLPQAGNIGGGGFMMIHIAEADETYALDYREMAPSAAHRDMFLDEQGNADSWFSRSSIMSSGVPGTVAGFLDAQERFGKLTRQQVLAPAIALARDGFPVSEAQAWSFAQSAAKFVRYQSSSQYFLPGGKPPAAGDLFRQVDLADTLARIAEQGRDGFYLGVTAQLIVDEMQRHNGLISLQDLANYQPRWREPVRGSYGGYQVVSMPPPSSGGVHLLQILGVLERLGIGQYEHNSADYLHYLVEAMRYAYADRSKYLGDPDFVDVPVASLLEGEYLQALADRIQPDQATLSTQIEPGRYLPPESPQTTHYSVWDGEGNVVSNTYTINFSYGNGIAVQGAGFLLNNEMDDFAAAPGVPNGFGLLGGDANAVEAGKRPLSSMTPTLVFDQEGKPVIATGSPGGSAIITIVLQVILNILEHDMSPAQAVSVPRIHHQWMPDSIRWESGISADTRHLMELRGHVFDGDPRVWGKAETIMLEDGVLKGGVDPRWPDSGAASMPAYLLPR